MRVAIIFSIVFFFAQCELKQKTHNGIEKINLLILSGRNNHDWQQTTPLLQKIYEESGRFSAKITDKPDSLTIGDFQKFDAILSNFTAWPEHEYRWPKETEDGLLDYIQNGGGFVVFHAASATFYDWPEYQDLVGTTWGDSTTHGKITPHKIVIKDWNHPITQGIRDFWITDELWVNAGVNSDLNVLAESYSDPTNKGRGMMEPVVHWKTKGKGRIFHNILGHNPRAIKNSGWKTLMLRGAEWAATGEVTIPVPPDLSKDETEQNVNYSWVETDTTIALLNNERTLWQYNYNTIKGKPFFHPVNIDNNTITWLSPEDHPWHLGIWHSWKFINGVNYWEYDRSEGVAPFNFLGITEVRNISIQKGADHSCRIDLEIFYHEKGGPDLVHEDRKVRISAPDDKGQIFIDYDFDLTALADKVEFNRTPLPNEENGKSWGGYAGLSIRLSQDFFEPSFINAEGSTEMMHGQPLAWRYYGLRDLIGEKIGTAVFTHPTNLNHPETWFVTNSEDHPFYYYSPAPIFNAPHTLTKGEKLSLKYRMQFYSGEVDQLQLEKDHQDFLTNENNK